MSRVPPIRSSIPKTKRPETFASGRGITRERAKILDEAFAGDADVGPARLEHLDLLGAELEPFGGAHDALAAQVERREDLPVVLVGVEPRLGGALDALRGGLAGLVAVVRQALGGQAERLVADAAR